MYWSKTVLVTTSFIVLEKIIRKLRNFSSSSNVINHHESFFENQQNFFHATLNKTWAKENFYCSIFFFIERFAKKNIRTALRFQIENMLILWLLSDVKYLFKFVKVILTVHQRDEENCQKDINWDNIPKPPGYLNSVMTFSFCKRIWKELLKWIEMFTL